jgi:hypothetical protein
MSRNGKIARLPEPVRERANRRLQDGEVRNNAFLGGQSGRGAAKCFGLCQSWKIPQGD